MRVIFFHTDDATPATKSMMRTWAVYLGLKRDPILRKTVSTMLARGPHSVWSFPADGHGVAHAHWLCVWGPILDGLGARWMAWSDVRGRVTTSVTPKGAYDEHQSSLAAWDDFTRPKPLEPRTKTLAAYAVVRMLGRTST